MEVNHEDLEKLFDSVCRGVRDSVHQSKHAIIRESHKRLSENAFDVSARHVIAASSLVRNDPTRSLDLLDKNPRSPVSDPLGSRLAGYAWLIKKEVGEARVCFDRAVRLDPNQPDCWNWLGQIAEREDDSEQAAGYYERGILFDDGRHDSALALSRLHLRNGQLKDAIHTLRVSLLRDRRSPRLNLALARLLNRRALLLGRRQKYLAQQRIRQESLQCYRVVNASAPTSRSLVMQGRLEQELFEYAGAKDSFQRAVKLDAKSAEALSYLAGANVDFGEIECATGLFEKSLVINPGRAETHFRYSRNKRFQSGVETGRYLAQLKQQLSLADLPEHKRVYLNFALAKVYDDLGTFDQAWTHYDRANRLKAGHSRSQSERAGRADVRRSSLEGIVEQSTKSFTPELFDQNRGMGHSSTTPIFIVGMPRSGTTLTEQILSSHRDVAGAGELNSVNQIRQEIARDHARECGGAGQDSNGYSTLLSTTGGSELVRYAGDYLKQLDRFRSDQRHVTDKMPTNFMHLGLIAMLFPAATVIHCRRNPMDVLVSCYCQNLNVPFCDLEQLVDYHRNYRSLMAHWQRVLPIKIHSVDYESLVSDPEGNTRALVGHCGLTWDAACMEFNSNNRAVHTPSKWQVRQPMYRSSVEKWRRFEKYLTPIADRIGEEIEAESRRECYTSV